MGGGADLGALDQCGSVGSASLAGSSHHGTTVQRSDAKALVKRVISETVVNEREIIDPISIQVKRDNVWSAGIDPNRYRDVFLGDDNFAVGRLCEREQTDSGCHRSHGVDIHAMINVVFVFDGSNSA